MVQTLSEFCVEHTGLRWEGNVLGNYLHTEQVPRLEQHCEGSRTTLV